jgi:predicted transcriptional regulator
MNLDDGERLALVAKALSSEVRIEMLKFLRQQDYNVNELAEVLGIPASSAASHVKVLEEAGVIQTELVPGVRGLMKVCSICLDHLYVEMRTEQNPNQDKEVFRMPIGSYTDYQVQPTCGLCGSKGPIGLEDTPRSFYDPQRFEAQILWLGSGYVEYRFPNQSLLKKKLSALEFSCELCSEDHEYNMDCPSDITLWINGQEAGTFTSPADFGGRRGKLNPEWWPDKNTQYGMLKKWSITKEGTYLDGEKISENTLEHYALAEKEYILLRLGIKEDAPHQGGMNLFGEGFGDYGQNLVLTMIFED